MEKKRLIKFLLAILLGVGIGLTIGWVFIKPKATENATITRLRPDYQTDAVLMVAEVYAKDNDLIFALDQLARIDHGDLLTLLGRAMQHAAEMNYSAEDQALLRVLLEEMNLVVYDNWKILRGWDG